MKKKSFIMVPIALMVLSIALLAPASAQYANSVTSYSTIGSGSVNNPAYIVGSSPDGYFTQLYGGNYGDGAMIVVHMNAQVSSGAPVNFYGYSYPGYYTHVYVYVSPDNSNWYLVSSGTVSPGGAAWINVGNAPVAFNYMSIVAYDDNGMSARLLVDCVYSA